ncbi:MAG TPA: antibiotic biosynthesis monooxygenase [Pelagibacterium sp.]|uniref:antibiotic biosynthesis monooxygenase family protein n=1 Tax=Pelagibacterium sp. TaxID=1967288 RepID=UPI002CDE58C4|nr:antibiotic biosynthesis monooxygenase [Pelagibacterium sp.]HWJ88457.1 antibiotic biosynthesis monooxygenase [Pelagibacterium sp.]
MIAVIFEVEPAEGQEAAYLDTAAELRSLLDGSEGFISVERFKSLTNPDKVLSLSFFESEDAVVRWRNTAEHRRAQAMGRGGVFREYRLRIAQVMRDYGMTERDQAPSDSRAAHNS